MNEATTKRLSEIVLSIEAFAREIDDISAGELEHRYFFDLFKLEVRASLPNPCIEEEYIEVTEADLPYLEKPEGDWEFRKPETEDIYLINTSQSTAGQFPRTGCPYNGVLQGYRWCKPRKVTTIKIQCNGRDATKEELEAAVLGEPVPDAKEQMFVLISEHDTCDPLQSRGAIIHEQYTATCKAYQVIERAREMGRYGQVYVGRLCDVQTFEKFKESEDARHA